MTPVDILLSRSKNPVYICSLANAEGDERHLLTRNRAQIAQCIDKWDKPGRGLYFCVSTISGKRRTKETASDCCFLHADIDFKHYALTEREILKQLAKLKMPPTLGVLSGNGLHAYWVLKKKVKADDATDRALKHLAQVVGGDKAVTHRAALLRLPGSHNTKNGAWKEVVTRKLSGKTYTFEVLDRWLDTAAPILQASYHTVLDNFAVAGEQYAPPIDVPARLRAMTYHGEGDTAVHLTQLSCVASMANRRDTDGEPFYTEDEITKIVLEATKDVAGNKRWNWRKEERKIRRMYQSWVEKHP